MKVNYELTKCQFSEECGGCSLWDTSYQNQIEHKRKYLTNLSSELGFSGEIKILYSKPIHVRDRADFQIGSEGELGFFHKHKKQIIDVDICLQMSEPLQNAYALLRKFRFPLKRGSVRLRVSAFVAKPGLWLDFANEDVKKLFDEPQFLLGLLEKFEIEMGQRRKKLKWDGSANRLRLVDPQADLWFATPMQEKLVPLYSYIGSFTQAGIEINQVLVNCVLELAKPFQTILELGCGIGNFTFPLAASGSQVTAVDNDSLALDCMKASIKNLVEKNISAAVKSNPMAENSDSNAAKEISVLCSDFYNKSKYTTQLLPLLSKHELLFVDPPRSGLGSLLDSLDSEDSRFWPSTILYVSCHPESWKVDAEKLIKSGYQLKTLCGVDQFPQTNHLELVSLFQRSTK